MCMRRMKGLPDDTAEHWRLKHKAVKCPAVLQCCATPSDVTQCYFSSCMTDTVPHNTTQFCSTSKHKRCNITDLYTVNHCHSYNMLLWYIPAAPFHNSTAIMHSTAI